jgi:hypothetical protein
MIRDMAQVVEHLPSKLDALSSNPRKRERERERDMDTEKRRVSLGSGPQHLGLFE